MRYIRRRLLVDRRRFLNIHVMKLNRDLVLFEHNRNVELIDIQDAIE